jgi:hypothetical protein
VLCFEHGPAMPRRIHAWEITDTFHEEAGFEVEAIDETFFETRNGHRGARAYLASIKRISRIGRGARPGAPRVSGAERSAGAWGREAPEQRDLAEVAPLHHSAVRFGRLRQGKLLRDDGRERAAGEPGDDGGVDARELLERDVGHAHAEYVGLAVHEVARGDLDGAAAADDDDTAARGEDVKVAAEVDVGQQLDDDVDAVALRDLEELVDVRRVAVVEGANRPLVEDEPAPLLAAGRAQDGDAARRGELHGRQADAAAGAVHEHGLAGYGLGAVEEGVVGRGVGHAERGALGEARARRRRCMYAREDRPSRRRRR